MSRRAGLTAVLWLTMLACMEPSEKRAVRVHGRITDPSGVPIPNMRIGVGVVGAKVEDASLGMSDASGEYRVAFELEAPASWYDSLAVGVGMTLCERWFSSAVRRPVGWAEGRQEIVDSVDLVVVPRPLGRLAVGHQSCSEVRRWADGLIVNSPFTLALIFDALTDSVFGRFAIHYLTASRSDTGPFRGVVTGDRLELELLEDGTGGCRGPIPLSLAVGPGNELSRGFIGPPANRCTLFADSVWLVTEPVDFFAYY